MHLDRCLSCVSHFKNCILFFFTKQPHRPRNEGGGGGGGGRHKKRVRQPHNTRERQRQLAVGHGEYIMPTQTVQYRAPHNVQPGDDTLLGMVMTDPRPPRPNSIELRRSYPPEEQHLYSPPSSDYRWKYRDNNNAINNFKIIIYIIYTICIYLHIDKLIIRMRFL